jgi:hypothetical protein
MTVADLRYFGALVSVVLFSSVVLLRQFLDGDLTERKHTGRTRRLVTPVLRQPAWPLGPRRVLTISIRLTRQGGSLVT